MSHIHIDMQNVSFGYEKEQPILQQLSLHAGEREAIGMMSDYLNMGQMDAAPRLNGTAPRAKFADVVLPTFPQRRNHTA